MAKNDTVILVTANGMGSGPEDLQLALIGKYIQILNQQEQAPAAICFYTEGVKLITTNSPILDSLRDLENRGTRLIGCLTCLDFYHLTDQIKVGVVGGMGDILEAQWKAGKVITL